MISKFYECYAEGHSPHFASEDEAREAIEALNADHEYDLMDVYREVDMDEFNPIEFQTADMYAHSEETFWHDTSAQTRAAMIADFEARQQLAAIITVEEIATLYAIDPGGIRATILRGSLLARKSGATWLIRRADAEARWGKRLAK